MTQPNQIQLTGEFFREEGLANAELTPGHLVEIMSTGKWRKHATAGGRGERAFAVEDALQGRTIDDAYDADDRVSINLVKPGSQVLAWLKAGENVAIGDELVSAGDGTLIDDASLSSAGVLKQVIAVATEALDLSGSADVATRIAVRVV